MAIKFYPPAKGATTNSGQGVPLFSMPDTLRAIEDNGVRLLIHGECTETTAGDPLPHKDRESYFMQEDYRRLRDTYPNMLNSLEHISTLDAVERVTEDDSGNTVCTITPHHPLLSADVAFTTSWANQARCMPELKGEEHRQAVFNLMVSGDARAILGTDCAPHLSAKKQGAFEDAACGCYVPHALAMYISMFAQADALDERLVRFACHNGPDWWDLPRPTDNERLRFRRELTDDIPNPTAVPEENDIIIPLGWTEDPDRLRIGMKAVLS
jgi:dihydroorotase